MAQKQLNGRIALKHDLEVNWVAAAQRSNFTPNPGEVIIYDPDENHAQARIKIGDGVRNVEELPFYSGSWNDLSDKPFYEINETDGEIKTLDSKFIGDDIARVGEVPSFEDLDTIGATAAAATNVVSERVDEVIEAKADWNQNDETALDYIKNRTHWTETIATWDGDIANKTVYSFNDSATPIRYFFVKSYSELEIDTYDMPDAQYATDSYTVGNARWWGEMPGYIYTIEDSLTISDENFGETTFGEAGLYFSYSLTGGYFEKLERVKYIDDKYISNNIARYNDLFSSIANWEQTDDSALNYIKNKPFGEEISDTAVLYEANFELDNSGRVSIYQYIPLVLGETYQVVVNEVEYEPTICKEYKSMYETYNILGNASLYGGGGEDTGENYLLIDNFGIWLPDKPNETVSIKLLGKGEIIKTLDEKYIPDTIARKEDLNDIDLSNFYSKSEIDNMEFITVNDIDTICGR